jgi:general secretion pathway protein D
MFLVVVVAAGGVRAQPAPDKDKKLPGDDSTLYSCHKSDKPVQVSFKPETELKEILAWVEGFTCKNFVLDPRIVSTGKKVTIISPAKMTPQDAYRVFLVALSTMGLTVVPKGNVLRIVEAATAKSETLAIMKKGVPADEDQMVRYVVQPSYVPVETLRATLDTIRSTSGSVVAAGNLLVITDYSSQIRDMMVLARSIDVPGSNDGIYTIPVIHADATQLSNKLNEILGITATASAPGRPGAPGAPGAPAHREPGAAVPSKIMVDERSNTLIVVSNEPGYHRVKALVDRLDITLDTEGGSAIHVLRLENALAKDLATTLNNALQGQNQQRGGQQRPGQPGAPGAPPQPQPQPAPPAPGQVTPMGGDGSLGASLEGVVRVVNDDPTNSLIIMSTGRDYLAVKDVVSRLDHPRRQVFIEALILEVQLDNTQNLGTAGHGGLPVDNGSALVLGGVETSNGPNSLNVASLAGLTGLIGGIIGAPLTNSQTFLGTSIPSYAILFQALANQNNTNVLSAPHIIAIDNEKAEFSVGNNIPYQAGLSFGGIGLPAGGTGTTGTGLPVGSIGQNIQREKLTLDLNVTPHISSNDSVRLEIEQNTKDLGGKDPQLGPTWTERKLKTQVVVRDQQSVVIGGLIQERDVYTVSKVPILGDIPILGYLFKYTTKEKKKTNLLILLTPYIIKDQLDLWQIRERKTREYREFTESFHHLNDMKYEPKIDYRRKRGLVEEINRQIQMVEDDLQVLQNVGKRQHVQGGAVEYRPSTIEAPDDQSHGTGESKPPPGGR